MSKGGRYLKKKTPVVRKKKGKKVGKIALLSLLVLLVVGVIGGVIFYNNMINLVSRAEVVEKDATVDPALLGVMDETVAMNETTEPVDTTPTTLPYTPSEMDIINILVVGQASRHGENFRYADSMILATINKVTKTLTLTSFLRDTYVDMPDYMGHSCGWNRINTVYHLGWSWGDTGGAMEMMNMCIKNNFGVEVDYNVEVDFNAFIKIINLIGGVRLTLTEEEAEYLNTKGKTWQEVTPGENCLFGDAALSYARMRKAKGDNDSDIKRTSRQRDMITIILKSLVKTDLNTLMDMAREVLPMITTNMTNDQITTCLWEILPILPELKIESGTCPVQGTYWGEVIDLLGVPSSVLKFEPGQQKQLMRAITEGETIE